MLAILFAAVWASLDEASQTLAENRVGAARDVAIDVSGAVVAQLLMALPQLGRLFRTAAPPRGVL